MSEDRQYKRYETHKAFEIHGYNMILCAVTYIEGSSYHHIDLWLHTFDDKEVSCKHCLKLLKHNPFVKRINASIKELKIS